jgi:heme/copper-type cytochrome/quinol oxidase subunit 3
MNFFLRAFFSWMGEYRRRIKRNAVVISEMFTHFIDFYWVFTFFLVYPYWAYGTIKIYRLSPL